MNRRFGRCVWAWCAVVFTAVAAFWWVRTEGFDFIRLDDIDYVVDNPNVRGGLTAEGALWAFKNCTAGSNWHPATWISLMADASIAGVDGKAVEGDVRKRLSAVMHRHNALVQGVAAALLLLVMLAVAGGRDDPRSVLVAALLALLWGLHPLRAECVCWVTERKEVLCTAFSLTTILLWRSRFWGCRFAALGAFALALLSKSVAVTVPLILIALDLTAASDRLKAIRRGWPFYAVMFVFCAFCAYFTVLAQTPALAGNSEGCPFLIRLACAVSAYAGHLFAFLVPVDLYLYHQFVDAFSWFKLIPGIVLCGIMLYATFAFLRHGKFQTAFLAAAWIGAGLLPMCGLVRVGIEMNPDRYGNWIGCGFVVVLFSLYKRHFPSRKAFHVLATAFLGALACLYAAMAWHYAGFWRSNYAIFQRTLSVVPDHSEALAQIAVEYADKFGQPDMAIEFFERSLQARPSDDVASQLAILLSKRATPSDRERIKVLCSNVRADHSLDDRGAALMSLGIVFMHEQNWKEAISCFTDAIPKQRMDRKLRGNTEPIEDNLMRIAMCYYNMRDYENARSRLVHLAASRRSDIREKARQLLGFIWQKTASTGTPAGAQPAR